MGLVVWASMLIVVALWVHNGGVQALSSNAASSMTTIGRLTGLISADLLLLQVLAMARVPFIERSIGQDRLTRWHRWVGFTSFWLMVAHIVFITLGYAGLVHSGVLAELWSLVTTAPGMLLATAGTALLVMIVVTSIRAARRKLRYESWHLLHLYAYLGAGLALPAPAVDRPGLPRLDLGHGVLVGRVRRGHARGHRLPRDRAVAAVRAAAAAGHLGAA